jgi:NAD(P)-dependent dehydrogenase (short-subunit alcohol dehydrogenase family)
MTWEGAMDVNLKGVYLCMKHEIPAMLKTGGGAIDYARDGIRINAVCPGFTHSEMVDPFLRDAPDLMTGMIDHFSASGRVGDSDAVADTIAFLCSHDARFVNGAALVVDGGDRGAAFM